MAHTTGGPKYQEELFEYELLLELKENPARQESLLFQSHDFLMDDRGYFYVQDGGNHRIAVFDAEGVFVYSIGREGAGPGEFGRRFILNEIRGDTLQVFDRSQQRIMRFLTYGTLIDVIPVRRPTGFLSDCYLLSDGRFLSLGSNQTNPNRGPMQTQALSYVHDSVGDTLSGSSTSWITTYYALPGTMSYKQFPLGPRPSYSYYRNVGWIVTAGTEPVLDILGGSGQIQRRFELDLPLIPITRNDYELQRASIDWAIDFIDYFIEVNEPPKSYREERTERLLIEKRNIELGDNRGFWQSVYIDDAGFIWLKMPEHWIEETEADMRQRFMVLDPQGEMLGYTRIPEARPFNIRKGRFLAREWIMEETRSSLKVYRIRPAVEGLSYPR